jgi:predicted dehydrogenase
MTNDQRLRLGMIGLGMIFEETYLPLLARLQHEDLYQRATGPVRVKLSAAASRTGSRAAKYQATLGAFANLAGPDAVTQLLAQPLDAVLIATPDDRHVGPAHAALTAGKHVLIEKPSVLSLAQLDELTALADAHGGLAKVVYHKLCDPDHKKLRTLVLDGVLQHVNNGYCSLLEPKSISQGQFAEWIVGRNPASYVAVHYVKLIDFTFAALTEPRWRLTRISATGQRGIVGPTHGPTWDSVQLQVVYTHPDEREAAFDIHTSWVTPDNFPGYVEQEVQFRFDNGVWSAHQRKRGVELTVEGRTPHELKNTPNYHYNGNFVEPWGTRSQRGYGIEVLQRFLEEIAYVEYGGPSSDRGERLRQMNGLQYNDLRAERHCVAIVQALEALLAQQAAGRPGGVVEVNGRAGGLALWLPGQAEPACLYAGRV